MSEVSSGHEDHRGYRGRSEYPKNTGGVGSGFLQRDPLAIVQKIVNRIQQLPAVLHCIRGSDALDTGWAAENLVQVEKQGDSSEFLKETIRNIPSGSTPPPPARHRLD
jgi:hypothetical protein